jgi:serine/threonine protein kinase
MPGLSKDLLLALYSRLDEALDLPPVERTAWLERFRAEHPGLAPELEALLEQEAELEARGFLEPEEWGQLVEALPSYEGLAVGAYTLERPLGHGGMGSVWLAHRSDGRYEGRAAVKLLNLSLLDPVGRERFRREGTVVASLTHPGIARLIDAGVTRSGQPYLVLEFVDGVPIDEYCDGHRLSPDRRLALFLQVLAAVGHAHAHLIVHRDLKPSNILVTADGSVKLLDFGIAKLLESDSASAERSLLTDLGGLALTPEFAAPEQVSSGQVTTATDVYALGVLLFVLLAGQHPTGLGCRTAAEHIRAVLDTEPPRLSAAVRRTGPVNPAGLARVAEARGTAVERLARLYRGDLDNILLKALKKNPAERYASVTAFADDLARYLKHEPVGARRDSVGYRLAKFVRRNRVAVIAGLVVAGGLVGATAFSVAQMWEARIQRDAAIRERQRADAQVEFQSVLLTEVGDRPLTMRQILDAGRGVLERHYVGDPRLRTALLLQLAGSYGELGDIKIRATLLARAESLAAASRDLVQLAEARCETADLLRTEGRDQEAWHVLARADSLARRAGDPGTIAICLARRSMLANEVGRPTAALVAARDAVAIKDSLGETRDKTYLDMLDLLAAALDGVGRPREAVAAYYRLIAAADSSGRGGMLTRAIMRHNLAFTLVRLGETAEAERLFHETLLRFIRNDPSGRVAWQAAIHYAEAALTQGHPDSALKYFNVVVRQGIADTNLYWEGRGLFGAGRAQAQLGRLAEARRAKARLERIAELYPRLRETDDQIPDSQVLGGWIAMAEGDLAAARVQFASALRTHGYPEGKERARLRPVVIAAARAALTLGDTAEALALAREARAIATIDSTAERRSAYVGEAWLLEALALMAGGDTLRARSVVDRALLALRHGAGADHTLTREAVALAATLAR